MKINRVFLFAVLGLTWTSYAFGNPQASKEENNQIEVRISPKAKTLKVGETFELQVEIWNVGDKQLFIEKDIYQLCSHSPLSLYLELGPPLKPGPGSGCAGDCMDDPKASFANRLVEQWISLPVGHSYDEWTGPFQCQVTFDPGGHSMLQNVPVVTPSFLDF